MAEHLGRTGDLAALVQTMSSLVDNVAASHGQPSMGSPTVSRANTSADTRRRAMTSDGPLQKADFGAIYDQPDPRAYFLTLEPFDYVIPQYGADLFARLLHARGTADARRSRLLDVCCSYGVVATLMKTKLDLAAVYAHYRDAAKQVLTSEQLVDVDRRLLQEHTRPGRATVIGLDVAPNAVGYALATGALDAGVVENLEVDSPSAELAALMSKVDLITTTGVGYVTERTFDRLLDTAPEGVWVAAFCLRTYDYEPIIETLSKHGLQTERLPQTFPQRRFTGPEEEQWAVAEVRKRRVDPAGKEAAGYFHAEFYLSRPASEVERQPLTELLPERHGSTLTPLSRHGQRHQARSVQCRARGQLLSRRHVLPPLLTQLPIRSHDRSLPPNALICRGWCARLARRVCSFEQRSWIGTRDRVDNLGLTATIGGDSQGGPATPHPPSSLRPRDDDRQRADSNGRQQRLAHG